MRYYVGSRPLCLREPPSLITKALTVSKFTKTEKTGFLDLPAEIRNRIYALALISHDEFSIHPPHCRPRRPAAVNILRTNRQIYREGTPVLYGTVPFYICCERCFHIFLHMIGESAQYLRDLRYGGSMWDLIDSGFPSFGKCTSLEALWLDLTQEENDYKDEHKFWRTSKRTTWPPWPYGWTLLHPRDLAAKLALSLRGLLKQADRWNASSAVADMVRCIYYEDGTSRISRKYTARYTPMVREELKAILAWFKADVGSRRWRERHGISSTASIGGRTGKVTDAATEMSFSAIKKRVRVEGYRSIG